MTIGTVLVIIALVLAICSLVTPRVPLALSVIFLCLAMLLPAVSLGLRTP